MAYSQQQIQAAMLNNPAAKANMAAAINANPDQFKQTLLNNPAAQQQFYAQAPREADIALALQTNPAAQAALAQQIPGKTQQFEQSVYANPALRNEVAYSPQAAKRLGGDYQNILGRDIDPAGQAFYQDQLATGARTYDQILAAIKASEEGVEEASNAATGLAGTVQEYANAQNASTQGLNQFTNTLDPWAQGGGQAFQQQAAFTGALGPEAQSQAYANYQEGPEQAFLREQGEQAVLRNASALGGLGGGNVRKDLMRFGTGLAAQDFQNSFNRLGSVSGMGGQAASQLASGQLQSGQFQAGQYANLGNIRYGVGQDLSANIGNTTTNMANAAIGIGSSDANDIQNYGGSMADVMAFLSNYQGELPVGMAEMLSNMASDTGTNLGITAANSGLLAGQGAAGVNTAIGNTVGTIGDIYSQYVNG